MTEKKEGWASFRLVAIGMLFLIGLVLTSLVSYLLFHSLAEMTIAVIAFSVFIVAWTSRRYIGNNYLLFVGIGFLFIAFLGLIHALAYKGMGVFPGASANLPTQLWIATRFLASATLLIAPLVLWKKLNWNGVFAGYAVITSLIVFSIYTGLFPTAYVDGSGLTLFKIASEYAIIVLFIIAALLLYRKRQAFEPKVFSLLIYANISAVAAELMFTLYVNVYGIVNMLGHVFVIISFFLIFIALVMTGIEKPYSLVFKSLKKSERSLQKEKDFAEGVISNAQAVIMVVNREGCILSVNPFVQEISGWAPEELISKNWSEVLVPKEGREEAMGIQKSALSGDGTLPFNGRLLSKDAQVHEVEWRLKRLGVSNNLSAILFIGHDVSEERRLERSLFQRAEEIARSNEELRQFAYVASHDLQEPLRMVTSYLGLLEKKYGDNLDGSAREYMDFAVQGAERMRELINDLLEYSRIDTRGKEPSHTDMNQVIEKTLLALKTSIDQNHAVVEVDKLPIVMADEGQMIQLMQNLIANAIKFHGEERPKIHVSVASDGGAWRFAVKDNGIGVEKEQQDRIFNMFQRLHTREEYEGTGIGLAICKKIVERHGGRLWVKSEEGKGATFCFTIPKCIS